MNGFGIDLVVNGVAVADSAAKTWPGGGRAVLICAASSYPTTCQLQVLAPDGTTWCNVGSNITANGISSEFAAPAGQYRMHNTGGTETALYVSMVRIPY